MNGNGDEWNVLNNKITSCTKCELHENVTNYVQGDGNLCPRILFVGEAPGKEEDKTGKPFIGKSGKILDKLLESINLTRKDIFIANIVKCRPPDNRDPKPIEKRACTPYLLKQIELLKPVVIASLGKHSMEFFQELFSLDKTTISDTHGKNSEIDKPSFKGTLITLYHPAVAVYNKNKFNELKKDIYCLQDFL